MKKQEGGTGADKCTAFREKGGVGDWEERGSVLSAEMPRGVLVRNKANFKEGGKSHTVRETKRKRGKGRNIEGEEK